MVYEILCMVLLDGRIGGIGGVVFGRGAVQYGYGVHTIDEEI